MKELITMWKNTRMIVLTAVTAAVYAAVLIPFKVAIPIVPGFTEVRPANVIPIICSLMFGPAAAWGAAIGNTIGDFFGTLGLGTIFGFVGNFLFGYIPYRMWRAFSKGEPVAESGRSTTVSALVAVAASAIITLCYIFFMESSAIYTMVICIATLVSVFLVLRLLSVRYFMIIFSASAACGVIIGWGVHVLGLVPFPALGNIIVLNNLVASAVLGPILLPILYPVVKRMGLLYTDVMEENELSRPRAWGSVLMILMVTLGLIAGNWIAIGGYDMRVLGAGFAPVLLFSAELESQSDLNSGVISQDLRRTFENEEVPLSDKASLSTEEADARWLITDGYDRYFVEKEGGKLKVYASVAGRGGLGLGLLPFILLILAAAAIM